MGVALSREVEIDNVNRHHIGQFLVVLSLVQAFRVQLAPVEQAALIHIVLVAELYLNVDFCSVLEDGENIEDT